MFRIARFPRLLLALAVLLTAEPALALRVTTYNLLNYSSGRTSQFRTVLAEAQPDLIVAQEISQTGLNNFLNGVLNVVNPGEWAAGPFVNGTDTDNAIFYRTAKVTLVDHFVISTALRDIDEWTIRPTSHTSSGADMRFYVVHLKASQGSANVAKRLGEVTAMRSRMETFPVGGCYVVLGDFNIYTFTESPYQYMISSANGLAGVVQDPIDTEGNWHNNATFADIHTQSPRTTQFGGGANGGMDDRFDMILVSPAHQDGEGIDILESTYHALGQDGQHFNGALNVAPFTVVPQAVAEAIHDASDHLPVCVEFQMPAGLLVASALDLGAVILGGSTSEDLSVSNDTPVPADELDYTLVAPAGFSVAGGSFQADAGAAANLHSVGLLGTTVGVKAGNLAMVTDDPDAPTFDVALTGAVLDHARPSTDEDLVLTLASVDLGSVAPTDTTSALVSAHNFDWDTLTALLDVYDVQLTGDSRFFVEGGFASALVGQDPASWTVAFDAVSAPEGPYAGTLTLSTRDQTDLSGNLDRADLVFDLSVTVLAGVVDAPTIAAVTQTGFESIAPNPFGSSTAISFGLERAGHVRLRLYDVTGRSITTLTDAVLPAGRHEERWDGRDAAGREMAPGIYFVRLETNVGAQTRKLVRLR